MNIKSIIERTNSLIESESLQIEIQIRESLLHNVLHNLQRSTTLFNCKFHSDKPRFINYIPFGSNYNHYKYVG